MVIQRELFFPQKIDTTIDFIRESCTSESAYVGFSGGKDSQVLLDLVVRAGIEFDAHFSPCVDPPELIGFIRKHYPMVAFETRETNMWKLIVRKKFPPTPRIRYCCEALKECHGWGRILFTGIRAEESSRRKGRRIVEFCLKGKGKTFVHPLLHWTEQEIWDYIKMRNLPYCSLYDKGFKRIGCVLCPMQSRKNKLIEAKRFPKFVKAYLSAFDKMLERRRESGLGTEGWETPEKVMEWWLSL